MRDILLVLVHSILTVVRLIKPGASCRRRGIGAHSASPPHPQSQSEARSRPACFRPHERRFMHPFHRPIAHAALRYCLKPSTLLHFHHILTKRKYHVLFSSKRGGRPGPRGPAQELLDALVEMKRRNPSWRCPRI